MSELWLTAGQTAELKHVTVQAVHQAIKDGRLPATKFSRYWLVRYADAELWQPRAYSAKGREPRPKSK